MGHDMDTEGAQVTRSVGAALGIGVLLLPFVFAWFTMRKGHSTVARVISFGWLILIIISVVTLRSPADDLEATPEVSALATDQDEAFVTPSEEEPSSESSSEEPAFFTGEADEVGDQIAVTDPQREALIVDSDSTTWNCSGLVNNDLLKVAFVSVAELSKENGLEVPMTSTCYFTRANEEMFGRQMTTYTMEFFVTEAGIQNFKIPNRSLYNYRVAQFFSPKNGDTRLTLFVTDAQAKNAKLRCVSLSGEIIGEDTCLKF